MTSVPENRLSNPDLLDLVKREQDYIIYYGDLPLKTRLGNEFCDPNERLLNHILTDIQLLGITSTGGFTIFSLVEFQKDYLEKDMDFIMRDFDALCEKDAFIQLKTRNKKEAYFDPQRQGDDGSELSSRHLNLIFLGFSSIILSLNTFIAENISHVETEEELEHPFIILLKQAYNQLPAGSRSSIHFLSILHGSGIVLPILFVLKKITASEYAKGVIAFKMKSDMDKSSPNAAGIDFPYDLNEKVDEKHHFSDKFLNIHRDAMIVADFLSYQSIPAEEDQKVIDLIRNGESGSVEFKSTFRWDLKAGKTNPSVERASLKTIAAFVNTVGGILLIGVRDDGSIEGIESDRFANEDKFLLHLWTLIRTSLGRDISPYIQTKLLKMDDKTVCIVHCSPVQRPVFLRQPGFDEEFYIRLGPSSAALDISEALKYIADHFRDKQ